MQILNEPRNPVRHYFNSRRSNKGGRLSLPRTSTHRYEASFLPSLGSGQVLWICTGRNKTFPPSTSLPVMDEIASVNTASLGGYLHSSKTRTRWVEGFHDELNGHVFDLERDGLRQVVLSP